MARGQRDPELERQWRERVARWATSGLSVRAFCLQHGLIETSFYYWKRELRARDASLTSSTVIDSPSPAKSRARKRPLRKKRAPVFVPVTVIPTATLSVEVRCPSGHVVLLSACEIASLSSLFAALDPQTREARSC
jgi:transposase-like protein